MLGIVNMLSSRGIGLIEVVLADHQTSQVQNLIRLLNIYVQKAELVERKTYPHLGMP